MPVPSAVLAAILLVTTPAAAPSADDSVHRLVGPSAELAHASSDLWRAALASRRSRNPDQDALVEAVFGFTGGAQLAAVRLASHDANKDEVDEILRDIDTLGNAVDDAIDQAPTTGDLRRAWDSTRLAWTNLKNRASGASVPSGPTGPTGPTTGGGTTTGPTGATGTPGSGSTGPAAPELSATIAETHWSGLMNPDLKLSGTFEGKGLVKAEISVKDSSDKVVFTESAKLTNQLATATSGKSTNTRVSVPWTYSFENEELASGQNTITVSVTNSAGTRAWSKGQIERKQF